MNGLSRIRAAPAGAFRAAFVSITQTRWAESNIPAGLFFKRITDLITSAEPWNLSLRFVAGGLASALIIVRQNLVGNLWGYGELRKGRIEAAVFKTGITNYETDHDSCCGRPSALAVCLLQDLR